MSRVFLIKRFYKLTTTIVLITIICGRHESVVYQIVIIALLFVSIMFMGAEQV